MLELKDISFSVNEENTDKEILKDINLTINDREFVVITGPNGGGKSTLAKVIAGINTPDGIIVKHLKMYYWDEVNVEEIDRVPQYDRYTEDEVKFRIKSLGKIKK